MHRTRPGFTLIEMLVVIAIIALLATLLIPLMTGAIEKGRRTQCSTHLKNMVAIMTAFAGDHNDYYPRLHLENNRAPYWFDQQVRDNQLASYGLDREICYCPSNRKRWNRDDFWNWAGGTRASVWGYAYLAADTQWVNYFTYPGLEDEPKAEIFARRSTDIPADPIIWTDLNRSLGKWGWFGPGRQGANHLKGPRPAGANEAFMDGHITWKTWSDMRLRLDSSGLKMYW
jgi:prepilin-type N-terminal cleavage/methylation domain-containing protein